MYFFFLFLFSLLSFSFLYLYLYLSIYISLSLLSISLLFKRTTLHYTSLPYPAYPPPTLTHKHSFTHLQQIIANRYFGHSIGNPFFFGSRKKYTKLHVTTLPYPAHTPSQPSNHPPPHTHT